MERWLRSFFAGTLLSGIVWGAGGVLLAGQDLIHQFFFGLLLAGLAAGAVSTLSSYLSSYRGVYAAFLLPSMGPFAVRMALYLDPVHVAMASMMLLFAALMLGISGRIHATIAESLRLRFRILDLVDTLSATKGNLEQANSALQREIGERRKAQEILMKSEQKLRLHAHQAPLARDACALARGRAKKSPITLWEPGSRDIATRLPRRTPYLFQALKEQSAGKLIPSHAQVAANILSTDKKALTTPGVLP